MRETEVLVEDIERLIEDDLGDRTSVPDALEVRPRVALEKCALVDVQVPVGDADGEVAERVGRDVDAAGKKTVALHRREGSIVPDDLGDRIRPRHTWHPRPPSYGKRGRTHGLDGRAWAYLAQARASRFRPLGTLPSCECVGTPSGVARVVPCSLFVTRRCSVAGNATTKWSGRFDRKKRTKGLRREPLTPSCRCDPVRDLASSLHREAALRPHKFPVLVDG